MPKRVQDIVPTSRRSIRSIPVEKSRTEDLRRPSDIKRTEDKIEKKLSSEMKRGGEISLRRMPFTPPAPQKKKSPDWLSGRKLLTGLGVAVIVIGVAYILSTYFSHATFRLQAKSVPITVDSTYVAEGNAAKGTLVYDLATIIGSESVTVPAISGQAINTKAGGKMTIYNSHSTTAQRLVAGTRIANDSGKIYRLTGSVVVPGHTVSANGNKIPGTISTSVVADQAGETYNISKTDPQSDFKIVAYQGTPKYDGFYARLSTDISGGFAGTQKTVSPAVMASSTQNLQSRITAKLLAEAPAKVPEGNIMYDSGYVIVFSTPIVGGGNSAEATITIKGTLSVISFKKSDLLFRIIGDRGTAAFGSSSYTSPGLESLVLTIANPKDFSPEKKNTLIVKLKGSLQLVGTIPMDEIKTAVAGMSLQETETVLKKYSSVIDLSKSGGEVVPPWAKVPTDTSRISVEIKGE